MSKSERLRDRRPLFYAYGAEHEFLSTEKAASATPEERIRSIWPFLVRKVNEFAKTLKPRELVNFDHEDILSELWAAVAKRDHKWTPERGKYITFAAVIVDRELCSIRDRARTVQSPRNSSCRIKEYQAEAENGAISARRLKTMGDIMRTGDGTTQIGPGSQGDAPVCEERWVDPAQVLIGEESSASYREAIRSAFRSLSAIECLVMSRLNGLGGRPKQSVWKFAWMNSMDESEVRSIRSNATQKIRQHLTAIRHPVAECA
ncbi:hypothetical protein SAMN05444166_4207 [Singulisphaera sp. GP187]|uniref:hypothetical protein n=1 Tax=Singulisphaera sp. GP187 TaxID=1882752 RepID=UPI0009271A9A|nr:hypothetical protein [Singulisphaera sp. GP187]SIO37654.1 hypothetical protein SAMN05444166_4207 [Singulisphaera sp. GP187]